MDPTDTVVQKWSEKGAPLSTRGREMLLFSLKPHKWHVSHPAIAASTRCRVLLDGVWELVRWRGTSLSQELQEVGGSSSDGLITSWLPWLKCLVLLPLLCLTNYNFCHWYRLPAFFSIYSWSNENALWVRLYLQAKPSFLSKSIFPLCCFP